MLTKNLSKFGLKDLLNLNSLEKDTLQEIMLQNLQSFPYQAVKILFQFILQLLLVRRTFNRVIGPLLLYKMKIALTKVVFT